MHKATLEIIGQTGFGHSFGALGGDGTKSENMKNYEALMKEFTNALHLVAPRIAKITGRTKIVRVLFLFSSSTFLSLLDQNFSRD